MSENGKWFCATHAWYNSNATPCPYCAPASPPPAATASLHAGRVAEEERRADAAEAEVARLTAERDAWERRYYHAGTERDAAEAALDALRGRIEALKSGRHGLCVHSAPGWCGACIDRALASVERGAGT